MVTVRKCCWFGALGPYLHTLTQQGYMAQLWAQTTTCRDAAPYGGIDAKFSTNPIAMAFPTKGDPVVSDFSTTTISMGKTKRMAQSGQRAPEPIFLDVKGNLSTNPKVALAGGSVLFIGGAHFGYKGYGLSLWAESIAALAGGSIADMQLMARRRTSQNSSCAPLISAGSTVSTATEPVRAIRPSAPVAPSRTHTSWSFAATSAKGSTARTSPIS